MCVYVFVASPCFASLHLRCLLFLFFGFLFFMLVRVQAQGTHPDASACCHGAPILDLFRDTFEI